MRSMLYPGRTARPMATATVAALLAGIVISGCGSSGTATPATLSTGTTTRTTAPASSPAPAASGVAGQLYKTPVSGTCYEWPGVRVLRGVIAPLQTAVNGTDDFGFGSFQANSDDTALNVAIDGLVGQLQFLPPDWAQAIFNQVITPANSHDAVPMSAAASSAESLSIDISHLCYVPS
jgi:hypothetical protein